MLRRADIDRRDCALVVERKQSPVVRGHHAGQDDGGGLAWGDLDDVASLQFERRNRSKDVVNGAHFRDAAATDRYGIRRPTGGWPVPKEYRRSREAQVLTNETPVRFVRLAAIRLLPLCAALLGAVVGSACSRDRSASPAATNDTARAGSVALTPAPVQPPPSLKVVDTLISHMDFSLRLCAGEIAVMNLEARNEITRGNHVDLDSLASKSVVCRDSSLAVGEPLFRRSRDRVQSAKVLDMVKDVYAFWRTSMKDLPPSGEEFISRNQAAYQARLGALKDELSRRLDRLKLEF